MGSTIVLHLSTISFVIIYMAVQRMNELYMVLILFCYFDWSCIKKTRLVFDVSTWLTWLKGIIDEKQRSSAEKKKPKLIKDLILRLCLPYMGVRKSMAKVVQRRCLKYKEWSGRISTTCLNNHLHLCFSNSCLQEWWFVVSHWPERTVLQSIFHPALALLSEKW